MVFTRKKSKNGTTNANFAVKMAFAVPFLLTNRFISSLISSYAMRSYCGRARLAKISKRAASIRP